MVDRLGPPWHVSGESPGGEGAASLHSNPLPADPVTTRGRRELAAIVTASMLACRYNPYQYEYADERTDLLSIRRAPARERRMADRGRRTADGGQLTTDGWERLPTPAGRRGSGAEAAAQDHLDQQAVGRMGDADGDAEVELPGGSQVEVERRHDLLLLLGERVEAGERPERAVVLEAGVDRPGEAV